MRKPRSIKDYGRQALLLEWEQRIDPAILRGVLSYATAIEHLPGIASCVPAYASLLVTFSGPSKVWRDRIYTLEVSELPEVAGALHRIPVCYGGTHGPDLEHVAEERGLRPADVIRLHTRPTYLVYLLGFRPGFAFMGKVDDRLRISRRENPRPKVPAGAVGLAGSQTGIYPESSPGGWQLIGYCPLPLVSAGGNTRFKAGDRVKFYAVEEDELADAVKTDTWPGN
ncbi:5-oxoprolinase subunit PxpB [Lewinella sp. IMCC34191]|uniref:5-oxoprolinase subunit PxpB n=1 Tax=Lewinella sp. IMCC34191 TaxID=2259172 RepID=UPI0013003798|nr:5-oxoprolinase subunit PxpB [Lewinella sp. IMCC34191]